MSLAERFSWVEGWIRDEETELLYTLASECPTGSNIVEIGSYLGRSTLILASGAQESGAVVYAIDPHHTHATYGFQFGETDNRVFMRNLVRADLAHIVHVINFPSADFAAAWNRPIALLFIDGDHEGDAPFMDYALYSPSVKQGNGKVAIHDSQGGWEKPTELVQHIVASGQGRIVRVVDQITVLELL